MMWEFEVFFFYLPLFGIFLGVVFILDFFYDLKFNMKEEKDVGKVNEYNGLNLVDANETITVLSTQVNSCTALSVTALPVTYGVYLNDDLIYSCNFLQNAETIYQAIRADMAGKAYEGKG